MKTSFWRHWWKSIFQARPTRPISREGTRRLALLRLEQLEDRTLLSGTPQMVADINPGPASSNPDGFVAIGATTYFTANDGVHGPALWKTDGTAAGTVMVKAINAGDTASYPGHLTNVNGTLFFDANDGNGYELWKSNGAAAGTVMVADINPGVGMSPAYLTNVNGALFFSADDGTHGRELWKSDGTTAGTVMVKDINPGSTGSNPWQLTNVNGTLFFGASDGTDGAQLWKSDGTTAGTVMVKDINPGSAGSNPRNLTNVNGTLFFSATDGTDGYQVWKSNGAAAGAVMVTDFNPGFGLNPNYLTNVNGTLFFTDGGYQLWKSNGTTAGTTLVADLRAGQLRNVNGTLFFTANDGTDGTELWKSDGTTAGTMLVKDINPGGTWDTYTYYSPPYFTPYTRSVYFPNSSNPSNLTNVNGTLFFTADDGTDPRELWQSDGTDAGTFMVAGVPSSIDLYPGNLTNVNGTLFFAIDDGGHGYEPWVLPSASTPTAASLAVSDFPASTTAGMPGSFTVTAENADGTTDSGYTGTVYFGSSDGQAGLPANYTFTPADAGVHTFSATLKTAGTQALLATDSANGSITGSETGITVLPTAASQLIFAQQPSTTMAGLAISPALTVDVEDPCGNVVTGDSSTVTLTLSSGAFEGGSTTASAAASDGVATFSTLKIDTAGSYTLKAADGNLTSANSGSFSVKAAAASTLSVSGFPSPSTAGAGHNFTVTLRDPYGNVAAGYTGTVHFKSSDPQAALPGNYTFTATDAGVHTFSATLKTAGVQSIAVTDTTTGSLTGTESGLSVNPAAASQFILTALSNVTTGASFSLTLTVEDAYGNVVTGYTGTVHFSSTDTRATLPSNYTFTAADKGVHTFTGLVLHKKGNQKITITDTHNSLLTGSVIVAVL
jgi:ELWxxDGT repeat protein